MPEMNLILGSGKSSMAKEKLPEHLIYFENDGYLINYTNYYDSIQGQSGQFFLSFNAGCARFLVPDNQKYLLREMKCKKVVMSKYSDRIEILFDDLSDMPFQITISTDQTDRLISKSENGWKFQFSVFIRMGEKFAFPCTLRYVS